MRPRYFPAVILCLLTGSAIAAAHPAGGRDQAVAKESSVKEFYIATAHLDGNATIHGDENHPPEAFPSGDVPDGGGVLLNKRGDKGDWRIRVFKFIPSQIHVYSGDRFTLHFVGVQGSEHRLEIEGHSEIVTLKRGEIESVTITATKPGILTYRSLDRQPSMSGQVVVLPKNE